MGRALKDMVEAMGPLESDRNTGYSPYSRNENFKVMGDQDLNTVGKQTKRGSKGVQTWASECHSGRSALSEEPVYPGGS